LRAQLITKCKGDVARMGRMATSYLTKSTAITAMVKEAVRLNREKGSPTMRSRGQGAPKILVMR
jgi:hypothetical protein